MYIELYIHTGVYIHLNIYFQFLLTKNIYKCISYILYYNASDIASWPSYHLSPVTCSHLHLAGSPEDRHRTAIIRELGGFAGFAGIVHGFSGFSTKKTHKNAPKKSSFFGEINFWEWDGGNFSQFDLEAFNFLVEINPSQSWGHCKFV